ncbi:MAG: hypothetical protein ACOCV4_09440 [Myxococcota bacterium]
MPYDGRHTKGVNVIDLVKTLRGLHKAGQIQDLGPVEQKYLQERVLVSSWYPMSDFLSIIRCVHQAMGGTDQVAEQMGEYGAQSALEGVHKAFLRHGDPEGTVRLLERNWPIYFDFGELHVENFGGRVELSISGYADMPRVHGMLLVGWVRKAVELSGGRSDGVRLDQAPWQGDGRFVVVIEP